jgi:peptidyl-prolyl cis-trans isomerase SurA
VIPRISLSVFVCTAIVPLCYALTAISCLAQTRPSNSNTVKPVTLVTINKTSVTADEFVYLYKKNHQDLQKDFTTEKINEYLNLFINFKLKVEEARNRKLDTTKVFLNEFNSYKDELRKPYLPDAKIVDSLVRLTYARMQEEINASHILVKLKQDAPPADTMRAYKKIMTIRKRVVEGEDFGKVASEVSDDQSAKTNGGNLGYFTSLQMVYPFETVAYTTKVGNVSYPVRTKFGYHIIKVSDRRPARGEVEVSHILLRTGGDKDSDRVKDFIFELHDQLRAGVNWDELCGQFSEDMSTKASGGRLKPFGSGAMSTVPEFERIAFFLQEPGEISDPFQTQYGWHIMRLEKKIPVPPFNEIQESLRSRVVRDERTALSKKDLQDKLRKEYRFMENQGSKSVFLSLADSSLQKGKWDPRPGTAIEKQTLFTLNKNAYRIKDAIAHVRKNQRPTTQTPEKYLDQLYADYVDLNINRLVESRISDEQPEYKFLLREYYEGILLFDIMEKEVWSKASQDSAGQHSHYLAHKGNFTAGERAVVTLYSSKDSVFASPLRKLIADSASTSALEILLTQYKVKTETGYFKKTDKAILQQVPWVRGVHSVENNGIYYLAWLKRILPSGFMSFEEARPAVISDYQTFLEENWVKQLKQKYRVNLNEKGKQYILQQLQTKG